MNSVLRILKGALLFGGLLTLFSLTSCNTIAGLGRDLENTVNALDNATHR
jgi:predicted small secreted protein